MSGNAPNIWRPTTFLQWIRSVSTSTGPAEIQTDTGRAIIKAIGNKEGEHALAREWVGTQLAALLGLRTFEMALMQVQAEDEIPLGNGRKASPGTAIVFRWESGHPWGGEPQTLEQIDNSEDIALLVVFDTWIRNHDRHPADPTLRRPNRDNVFLSETGAAPGRFVLKAMDHTHCFAPGADLNPAMASIEAVKDEAIYGLFPEFVPYVTRDRVRAATRRLKNLGRDEIERIVASLPADWQVSRAARKALVDLLCDRAVFLADTIMDALTLQCDWGRGYDQTNGGET